MVKWIPTVIGALVALLGVFSQPVQDFIVAHPAIGAVLAGLYAILTHLLKPPQTPS